MTLRDDGAVGRETTPMRDIHVSQEQFELIVDALYIAKCNSLVDEDDWPTIEQAHTLAVQLRNDQRTEDGSE